MQFQSAISNIVIITISFCILFFFSLLYLFSIPVTVSEDTGHRCLSNFICLKMDLEPNFTFIPLAQKKYVGINDKKTQQFLMKWGLKGNISIQNFCFNEPFQPYHKYHLAEAFFKDETVANMLKIKVGDGWSTPGIIASSVEIKQLQCSVLNMSFFDQLTNANNNIVFESGNIRKRCDIEIEGFSTFDNLRGMLLDEECNEYNLYKISEREEFIFAIFQMLVLGGSLCQYEDTIQPYLDTTKIIYKDLIRVEKHERSNDFSIATMVLKVEARDSCGDAYFPRNPSLKQNLGFLLIDSSSRQITTFLHQYGYCI